MSDEEFEMRGAREEDREEFRRLIDVCENAIRSLEKLSSIFMDPSAYIPFMKSLY